MCKYQRSSSESDRVAAPKRFVVVSKPKWFVIVFDSQIDFVMVALGVALPLLFLFDKQTPWPPETMVQWLTAVVLLGLAPMAAAFFAVRFVRGVLAIRGHKWGRKFKLIRMGRYGRVYAYVTSLVFGSFSLLCLVGGTLECLVSKQDTAPLVLKLIGIMAGAAFIYLFLLCWVLRAIDEGRRERNETKH